MSRIMAKFSIIATCLIIALVLIVSNTFMVQNTITNNVIEMGHATGQVDVSTPGMAEVKGAHGGQIFVAVKRREYSGPRPFLNQAPPSKPHPHGAGLKHGQELTCKKWAVLTTIFGPTELVRQLVVMKDWCIVIVGDKKSPPTYNIQSDNLIFLGLEEQEALPYKIIPLLKWNHFGRKNIGFLYAMHHGAEVIYDTDDDNILKIDEKNGKPLIPNFNLGKPASPNDVIHSHQSHVYNPYPNFESLNVKDGSPAFVWPRGFPLDLITDESTWKAGRGIEESSTTGLVTIVQSLADHDPDVDALYRLTSSLPLRFQSGGSPRLEVIPSGTMTPFNAQATLFGKDAFWGMLLPVTVHGRVSDIWRSYFTGRIMWEAGQNLAFASPMVTQCRNPHSYVADFDAESDLYERTGPLVSWLLEWRPASSSLEGMIEEMAVAMYEMDFLHDILDVDLAIAWIKDLRALGVEIPKTLSKSDNNFFEPYAEGTIGATKIAESDGTCEQASVIGPSLWPRPQQQIALVVMTKDDLSLLSRFIAYHGNVFGFQNIYVFDGSTGPQKAYLESIAAQYPINIRHSLVDLNGATTELFDWITEIKGEYDWIFKVDTDEFLVSVDRDSGSPSLSTHPALLLPTASMTSSPTLKVDILYNSAPVETGPPTDSERLAIEPAGDWKKFYNGHHFSELSTFNLGSHADKDTSVVEGIGFVHYARSYDDRISVATSVITSHGYVTAIDSKNEMIKKLTALDKRPACNMDSCHKIYMVLDDLTKHDEMRSAYYNNYKDLPAGLVDFKEYLGEIFEQYPNIVQP